MGKSVLLGSVTALEFKLKMQQPNVTGKSMQPAPNKAFEYVRYGHRTASPCAAPRPLNFVVRRQQLSYWTSFIFLLVVLMSTAVQAQSADEWSRIAFEIHVTDDVIVEGRNPTFRVVIENGMDTRRSFGRWTSTGRREKSRLKRWASSSGEWRHRCFPKVST